MEILGSRRKSGLDKVYWLLAILALVPAALQASVISYTGTLSSSTDVFETTFTLTSPATIELQSLGFGGGTNASGQIISAGGTDPFLGIFSGTARVPRS
jgi:hypothetical protein